MRRFEKQQKISNQNVSWELSGMNNVLQLRMFKSINHRHASVSHSRWRWSVVELRKGFLI